MIGRSKCARDKYPGVRWPLTCMRILKVRYLVIVLCVLQTLLFLPGKVGANATCRYWSNLIGLKSASKQLEKPPITCETLCFRISQIISLEACWSAMCTTRVCETIEWWKTAHIFHHGVLTSLQQVSQFSYLFD